MTHVKGTSKKVKFTGNGRGYFNDPAETTKSLVLLSIEGNPHCHGEDLGAIIEEVTTAGATAQHFTTFLVADEIYWHNLKKANQTPEKLKSLKADAVLMGDNYLNDNLGFFLKILTIDPLDFDREHGRKTLSEKISLINTLALNNSKPFEILRWADWMQKLDATGLQDEEAIKQIYSTNELPFKNAVENQANNFASRKMKSQKHEAEHNHDVLVQCSKDYLIAEGLPVILGAAIQDHNFIVYPGKMPLSFKPIKEHLIRAEHPLPHEPIHPLYEKFITRVSDPKKVANWINAEFIKAPKQLVKQELPQDVKEQDVPPTLNTSVTSVAHSPHGFYTPGSSKFKRKSHAHTYPVPTTTLNSNLIAIWERTTMDVMSQDIPTDEKIYLLSFLVAEQHNQKNTTIIWQAIINTILKLPIVEDKGLIIAQLFQTSSTIHSDANEVNLIDNTSNMAINS